MKFLRSYKAEKLVDQLISVRHHEEADNIAAISKKLVALGPAAVPHVIDALGNADRSQTLTFVEVLSELLEPKALPDYIEGLKDNNQRIVSGVAWALTSRKTYDPNELLDLLDDPDVPKATLMQVLGAHKDQLDVRKLLTHAYELAPSEKEAAMKLVAEMSNESLVPELLSRLTGKDALVRTHIINILARFRRDDVQRALQSQLNDRSKIVRQAALSALARMAEGLDISLLGRLLEDPEIEVQNKAVEVLIKVNHPKTPEHLIGALKSENEYSRRSAVEVLNEVGDSSSIKTLLEVLKDDDWWVRSRAVDALAKIGGPRVVDATLQLIKDPDESIRRAAIEIINATKDERAVKFLIEATRDSDWWVRERAADALAEIGDKKAMPALQAMLSAEPKSIPAALRAIAVLGESDSIPFIVPLLDRPEKDVRVEAMRTLTRLADEATATGIVERIQPLRQDSDAEIRNVAERAQQDLDARFSATAIAENIKAEKMAEPAHTLLINADEAIAQAKTTPPSLDLAALQVGDMIENRYKFIQQIGKGAFGTVILVEDTVVAERLVLKFLNKAIADDEEMLQRFVHELRFSRKITHRNVIRIYDFVNLSGLYAISMEYFPSHALSSEMTSRKPLDVSRALRITADIANGMSAAHQVGIVHRDLKPANVLVNDKTLVKVVDFGVAAAHGGGDTGLTKTGYVIGSPKYMAPEQILGKKVDQRADVYSLGVILYELLTGTPPYTDGDHMAVMYQHVQGKCKPIKEANPKLPADVVKLATKVMEVDKINRHQSMEELRDDLESLLEANVGAN
ncbi:MAG: HEAT repeat domain-containing protein [Gammaproteobacteria bacterium]|nr:HEAT repeat domain-containing protein [Gammaproteobacteria bacterium]NND58702.1 protein kinase [Gammaproteobacteria bacterium]